MISALKIVAAILSTIVLFKKNTQLYTSNTYIIAKYYTEIDDFTECGSSSHYKVNKIILKKEVCNKVKHD